MKNAEHYNHIKLIQNFAYAMEPLPVNLPSEWALLEPNADMPVLNGIKAVLFDLYGTLFISGAGEIAAAGDVCVSAAAELAEMKEYFTQAVKSCHEKARAAGKTWPEVQVEEIWAGYRGSFPESWDTLQKMRQIQKKTASRTSLRRFGRELALHYELAVNPVYPMPHAKNIIKTLVSGGLKLGIISNAQFFSPLLFNAFFNGSPIELGFDPELLIYSFEEQEAKPSPRLFAKARKILARQNIKPEETLYIGNDMRNDIIPAAAAGFVTALFAGDSRSLRLRKDDPACAGKKPCYILRDLEALVQGQV